MPAHSAGLLLFRRVPEGAADEVEVLIVHPGGPFWAKKDAGAWSVPKGEYGDDEDPWTVACREFTEELGVAPTEVASDGAAPFELGEVRLKSGKRIVVWALEGDFDTAALVSNTFEIEWPPRSQQMQSFPEVDRCEWCAIEAAREKLNPAQGPLLDELVAQLSPGTSR